MLTDLHKSLPPTDLYYDSTGLIFYEGFNGDCLNKRENSENSHVSEKSVQDV